MKDELILKMLQDISGESAKKLISEGFIITTDDMFKVINNYFIKKYPVIKTDIGDKVFWIIMSTVILELEKAKTPDRCYLLGLLESLNAKYLCEDILPSVTYEQIMKHVLLLGMVLSFYDCVKVNIMVDGDSDKGFINSSYSPKDLKTIDQGLTKLYYESDNTLIFPHLIAYKYLFETLDVVDLNSNHFDNMRLCQYAKCNQ